MKMKVEPARGRGSIVPLLVLIAVAAGILAFVAYFIESRAAEDRGRQAGTSAEVQVDAGSEKATLKITVTSVRPGSAEDLASFDIPAEAQDKIPHYVWFRSKVTSGSLNREEPFPITMDQWEAVSSGGETLKGIPLDADLQPCPRISTEQLSAGETDEGCFMVFNEAGKTLKSVALHLGGGEIIRWRL